MYPLDVVLYIYAPFVQLFGMDVEKVFDDVKSFKVSIAPYANDPLGIEAPDPVESVLD